MPDGYNAMTPAAGRAGLVGTTQITYLGDLGAAGPVNDTDSTFWCDSSLCSAGVDLKSQSALSIAHYVLGKLQLGQPLVMTGMGISLQLDPSTLAVHNGSLTVIGGTGDGGPGPGGGVNSVTAGPGIVIGGTAANPTVGVSAPLGPMLGGTGLAVSNTAAVLSGLGGAPINSPNFQGTPQVPTANPGTATQQAASTAFVSNAVSSALGGINTGITSLVQGAGITVTNPSGPSATIALASDINLLGVPTANTAPTGTSTRQLATTEFVLNEVGAMGGGTIMGVITQPPLTGGATTGEATIGFASNAQLPGTPSVQTPPPAGSNDNSIPTTSWVLGKIGESTSGISAVTATAPIIASTTSGVVSLSMQTTGSGGTVSGITFDAFGRITGATNPGYLTNNQPITLTGDVTGGPSATTINTTLGNIGTAGTYNLITTNAQGRVISGSNQPYLTSVTLAGDVTGASGSTTVERLRGQTISTTAPSANQVLQFLGGQWTPAPPPTGLTVPNASLLGGNGTSLIGITLGTNLTLDGTTLNATGGQAGTGNPGGSIYNVQYNRGSNQFGGTANMLVDNTTGNIGLLALAPTGGAAGNGRLIVQSETGPPGQTGLGSGSINVGRIIQVNKNTAAPPVLDPDHTALQIAGTDGNAVRMAMYSFGTAGQQTIYTQVAGFGAGGTAASPAATPDRKVILGLHAFGHTGSGWLSGSNIPVSIDLISEGQFSTANNGTRVEFGTTAVNTTNRQARMNIRQGVVIGDFDPAAPAATDLGHGTINARNGLFDNGVRLGPSVITASVGWTAGTDPNSVTAYINNSGRALTCTWITAICEIPNGTNAFVDVYAAGNNTTIANAGAKVNTQAFNANGVGGQYQTLLQNGTFVLNPGDRLGLRVQTPAPTWTASVATFTINLV